MLINKAHLRQYLLDKVKEIRHHEFTRVDQTVYPYFENIVETAAYKLLRSLPSAGKTISAGKEPKQE